jgi:hypothetical protein
MSELSIRVVAGRTLEEGERLTKDILNAMAVPSVTLEGLVGSATIAPGAVGSTELATAAVTPIKVASSVAGAGLVHNSTTGLAVNVDGATLEIDTDVVRVKDGGITAAKLAANAVLPPAVSFGLGSLSGTSGDVTVDALTAFTFYAQLTDTITKLTVNNLKQGQSVVIALMQAAAGSKTVTWDAAMSIRWRGGTTPVLTTTANKVDVFTILKVGAVYFGNYTQNY